MTPFGGLWTTGGGGVWVTGADTVLLELGVGDAGADDVRGRATGAFRGFSGGVGRSP